MRLNDFAPSRDFVMSPTTKWPLYVWEVICMVGSAIVKYHTACESARYNALLIEDVLAELAASDPGGLWYQVFRFDGGAGFMHIVVFDGTADPFARCAAYQRFHRDFRQRLAEPPAVMRGVLIGSYRAALSAR
jgi:hypothetical protein